MREYFPVATLIALGSCTDLVPNTLLALSDVDPLTADPADIAIMLDLPDGVAVLPDSTVLTLGASNQSENRIEQSFVLHLNADVLPVGTDDHADLRALQDRISQCKAADPNGTTGSLGIGVVPCRTGAEVPEGLRASALVRLQQNGPFLPLIKDGPLAALLSDEARDTMEPYP